MLKELFFPSLCHRCLKKEKIFLCSTCLLGIEFAEITDSDQQLLFDAGTDFLYIKRKAYQEIIISCAIIQLKRLGWSFSAIESEPELIYLKKALKRKLFFSGSKTLYLISREVCPILPEPMKNDRYILVI